MPKNIVICCDGTGNEVSGAPTNILRLFYCLPPSETQIVYYDGGVGTLIDPMSLTRFQKWLRRTLDAAIGHTLRSNFCQAYQFLASVYQPGDRIFLFGFSRGAYTVRAVAGAIHRFGILRPELANLAEYAWTTYSDELRNLSARSKFAAANRFKKHFAVEQESRVWFTGVFDTVSSLGWFWDYRTLPNTDHNPAIDHVRHALAIDERRGAFGANRFAPKNKKDIPQHLSFKEVWFPGVHSDIGGGYPEDESGLAKITLQWMLREAESEGLIIDSERRGEVLGTIKLKGKKRHSTPDPTAQIHDSLGLWTWKLFEWFPRRAWSTKANQMRWHWPNRSSPRPYEQPLCVHESVLQRAEQAAGYGAEILALEHTIER